MNIIKIEDQMARLGESRVYMNAKAKSERVSRLKDADVRDRTMAFIFGKSTDNPLKDITANEERENKELDDRGTFFLAEAKKIVNTKKFK